MTPANRPRLSLNAEFSSLIRVMRTSRIFSAKSGIVSWIMRTVTFSRSTCRLIKALRA